MKEVNLSLENMTQAELAELATACLEKLEPGKQPLPLFTQLARLVVTSTVEMVPFRIQNNKLEVLLTKRPDDDPWWPGQWHLPGTIILPTDEASGVHDYDTLVERLYTEEFGQSVVRSGEVNIFDIQRRLIPRGSEQTVFGWSLIDLAEGFSEVQRGKFFDVDMIKNQLSERSVIEGHLDTVNNALNDYRKSTESE
jgi:hypothetical protein